jgi:hypothetical protein
MATTAHALAGPSGLDRLGELRLLVFSPDGVPTWEVRRRTKVGRSDDESVPDFDFIMDDVLARLVTIFE